MALEKGDIVVSDSGHKYEVVSFIGSADGLLVKIQDILHGDASFEVFCKAIERDHRSWTIIKKKDWEEMNKKPEIIGHMSKLAAKNTEAIEACQVVFENNWFRYKGSCYSVKIIYNIVDNDFYSVVDGEASLKYDFLEEVEDAICEVLDKKHELREKSIDLSSPAQRDMLYSLKDAIIEAGGNGALTERLLEKPLKETISLLASNGVRFYYKKKEEKEKTEWRGRSQEKAK